MIAKKMLLFAGFLVSLLILPLGAQAYDIPNIFVKEINLKQSAFNESDIIEGTFLILNAEKETARGLSYSISLDQNRDVLNKKIYSVSGPVYFDRTLEQSFSYPVPKIFPEGDYKLKIQLFSQSGIALGWKTADISIKGTGIYLNISSSYIIKDQRFLTPDAALVFDAGVSPKIKFTVFNPIADKINFTPQTEVYFSYESAKPLENFSGTANDLSSKETRDISFDLPKYQKPGLYVAKIILMNNDIAISKPINFSWTIKGLSAEIVNAEINADSLEAGKEIKVAVEFAGMADRVDVGEAKISVNIYDGKTNKSIASGEKNVAVGAIVKEEIFSLTPKINSSNFLVEIKMEKDGKDIASYSINATNPGVYDPNTAKNDLLKEYLIAFLLILIIIFFVLFFMKLFSKGKKIFLLLILIGYGFFSAGPIKADFPPDLGVMEISPGWDTVLDYGDAVNFIGSVDTVPGGNLQYVTDLTIENYMCDINKVNCTKRGGLISSNLTPSGVAYDSANNKLYVLDGSLTGARIIKINAATKYIEEVIGVGRFSNPQDIFYKSNYLYIADTWNDRIVRYNLATGAEQFFTFGGVGDEKFMQPEGVFAYSVGAVEYMLIADTGRNRVVRINLNTGEWISFAPTGTFAFSSPKDVSYDPTTDYIFVADSGNDRIVKFKSNDPINAGGTWGEIATNGTGVEVLVSPKSIFYSAPYLYITDTGRGRIVRVNPASSAAWTILGSAGSGEGQFSSPSGVFYSNPNLYVADMDNKRVVKFNPTSMNSTWDTYNFSIGSYDNSATVPSFFNPGFQIADGVTDYDGDGSVEPSRSFYLKTEARAVFDGDAVRSAISLTRVNLAAGSEITPVTCKLYGVTDTLGSKTGIIIIDKDTGFTTILREFSGGDFENLDIDPRTNYIYIATDQSTEASGRPYGQLVMVDGATGELTETIGVSPGVNGIVALSFRPTDGTLWAWSKEDEEGLIKMVVDKEYVISSTPVNLSNNDLEIEGLAWNKAGTILYASDGDKLYKYEPSTNPNKLLVVTGNMGLPGDAEGLDMREDGNLYVGVHEDDNIYTYDPIAKNEIVADRLTLNGISLEWDIEGLAWPEGCSNNSPSADPVTLIAPSEFCDNPEYTFNWIFADDPGDTQSSFWLQVDNNSDFSSLSVDRKFYSSRNREPVSLKYDVDGVGPSNKLAYGTTYYWRVKVWDNKGMESAWAAGDNFNTEPHMWPIVGFQPPPPEDFSVNVSIHFITSEEPNDSICFKARAGGGNIETPCAGWKWDFCYGEICSDNSLKWLTSSDTYHTYSEVSSYNIVLWVKDKNNNICSNKNNPKYIGTKKPKWKEVVPK